MKVILKQDVVSLGKLGDIVKVSDGYARNYLIPKGLAVEATEKNMKILEQERKHLLAVAERERKKAQDLARQLSEVTCIIARRVGEQEKMFGSVSARDIEKALNDMGIPIERKSILLKEPLKSLGEFTIKVKLSANVSCDLKLRIVPEE